ncbi:MAG: MmcQ/YjbR family DNA-binding protein [Acidimicrobiales bacterium]
MIASQPGATEDFPFGEHTAVWRVAGKIFAFLPVDPRAWTLQLKADPGRAEVLRREWAGIGLPYHLNKRHWIQVRLDRGVPAELVAELIEDSYDLVVAGLTRSQQAGLPRPA